MDRRPPSRYAFTLGELIAVLSIITFVFFIIYPIFAQSKNRLPRNSCLSNVKQIGLGMMMYCQDYDEQFPPTYSLQTGESGPVIRAWGGDYIVPGVTRPIPVASLVSPYTKNPALFRCPTLIGQTGRKDIETTYMYNDLAAGVRLEYFMAPAGTALFMDGEPYTHNFGHARSFAPTTLTEKPIAPVIMPEIADSRMEGGQVITAAVRHAGGANYGFADGHAKWMLPEKVFFPVRENGSRSHRDTKGVATGPDPAGGMTFAGQQYSATFHIK